MTNREIFTSAINLFGTSITEEQEADFEERAPYLLAAFCTEAARLDADYRDAKGLDPASEIDSVSLPLISAFPCADRFSSAAASYLAAMLIIDENIELSDKFFDNYCDSMARIQSEIPAKIEKISQTYL